MRNNNNNNNNNNNYNIKLNKIKYIQILFIAKRAIKKDNIR